MAASFLVSPNIRLRFIHGRWNALSTFSRSCRRLAKLKLSVAPFLAKLVKHDPHHPYRYNAEFAARGSPSLPTSFGNKRTRPSSWFPLAFSPVWARAKFAQQCQVIHDDLWAMQRNSIFEFPSFGIAWSLGGKDLYRCVQGMQRKKLVGHVSANS